MQQLRFLIITLFLGWISLVFGAPRVQLLGAQVVGNNELIFQLTAPTKYHYFMLSSPKRLVIDLDQAYLTHSLNNLPLNRLSIKTIRTSLTPEKLRIVLDFASQPQLPIHVSLLSKTSTQPWRLSLVLGSTKKVLSSPPPQPVKKNPPKVHPVIIVIDPGHGGKDPGARGKQGTCEKNVVLGIAQQLQQLINQQAGMRAVLTRQGDYYIDLRQRLKIARKNSADIFVSIHADAFNNPYSHGASVYALSERGGTSEAARWLAEKENYSELGGVDLAELDDKNGMVRSVLIDLSQTATIGASLELGNGVLKQMGSLAPLHHQRVEQAPFVVLKSLDIPSILIETGFISNPQEEIRLKNAAYQKQLARAILQGLKSYLALHPSMSTR